MRNFIFAALVVLLGMGGLERTAQGSLAVGCRNEVLKRGYAQHLPPTQLTALTGIYSLTHRVKGPIGSREVMDQMEVLANIKFNALEATAPVLTGVIYPLERKNFIDVAGFAYELEIETNYSGRTAAANNFLAFWDIYLRSCEKRRAKPATLGDLRPQYQSVSLPPINLSEYLMLIPFLKGAYLGTYDSYEQTRDALTYYREWHPRNPGSTLQRLIKLSKMGYLDVIFRGSQGTQYVFAINPEGKLAVQKIEAFYLNLLGHWLDTDRKRKATYLRNGIKELNAAASH